MPKPPAAPARTLVATLAAAAGLLLAVPGLAAQEKVYTIAELSAPPRVKSTSAAANAVQRSLPGELRSIGGKVQLQFVVGADGKVEPGSIEVVVASASALGEAARKAVQGIDFHPGKADGKAVRAMVRFPIVYDRQ